MDGSHKKMVSDKIKTEKNPGSDSSQKTTSWSLRDIYIGGEAISYEHYECEGYGYPRARNSDLCPGGHMEDSRKWVVFYFTVYMGDICLL